MNNNIMKKLVIFLFSLYQIGYSQNIFVGNFIFSNAKLIVKTMPMVPGLVQTGTSLNAPSLGTISKVDGPYLQTFTNHPLNFTINNSASPDLQINTAGNVQISNYLRIDYNNSITKIQQKKIVGTTDNFDGSNLATNDGTPNETRIAHGLDASKIMSISVMCNVSPGFDVGEEFQYYTGYQLAISYDNTFIHVWNYPGNSNLIRNKPFKFLITFKK
jgi:hypothetical protein